MRLPEERIQSIAQRIWPWRWALAIPVLIIVIVRGIRLLARDHGDLYNHLKFGHRFLDRQFIYEKGLDIVYPPLWAMAHAPFTLLPRPLAAAAILGIGLALGVVLVIVLVRLGRRAIPIVPQMELLAMLAVLLLALRFLLTDLSIGAPNLAMVALTWLGIYCWSRGRDWTGGALVGLAVALKCTAGLFIAWFLWKRQWKMAASSALATILLSLAPVLWSGPANYQRDMGFWINGLVESLRQPDPSIGILGQEQIQNNALKSAMARYLMHLPPDHAGRLDHWLYVDLLDLSPSATRLAIALVSLLLLAAVAWLFRARIRQRDGSDVLLECAAVSVLLLLLSPVTWSAHLVWLIPGLYLSAAWVLRRGELPFWLAMCLAAYIVLILVLNRGLLGRQGSELTDAYHVQTWATLLLLAVLLALHQHERHQKAPQPSSISAAPLSSDAPAQDRHPAH